jgi:hypothetical protein
VQVKRFRLGKGQQNTDCTGIKLWTVTLRGHVLFGYVDLKYLLYNYNRLISKFKFVDKCRRFTEAWGKTMEKESIE